MGKSILVVDDEQSMRIFLTNILLKENYSVVTASSGAEAVNRVTCDEPDVVLLDLRLPDMDGMTVLEKIKKALPAVPVIIITAHGGVQSAVEAMKKGAYHYLTKPFKVDELLIMIERALDREILRREISHLRKQQQKEHQTECIVGVSPAMQKVHEMIERITESDATNVLIYGESGTGKQLVANAIHYKSRRASKPFVEVNCASIPDTLMESELFGFERGAFTDAREKKTGLLEEADGGTFFFDEIGDMSLHLQAKLLKFLDTKTFRRVGGTKLIQVDVRIIAATNQDLPQAVEKKRFRADLYYRLDVATLRLPSLRERKEDVPLLAEHLTQQSTRKLGKKIESISPEALKILAEYDWPGNVRELENVIERAAILSEDGVIRASHIPMDLMRGSVVTSGGAMGPGFDLEGLSLGNGKSLKDIVQGIERTLISDALQRCGGNQVQAAKLLGITRDILRYRMKQFELPSGRLAAV
ncbi:MAG: sigma-54 dependent transcriptional regulator [bacterium]|nr:sigma-54 dependent transcriptional regulator [bacterium]